MYFLHLIMFTSNITVEREKGKCQTQDQSPAKIYRSPTICPPLGKGRACVCHVLFKLKEALFYHRSTQYSHAHMPYAYDPNQHSLMKSYVRNFDTRFEHEKGQIHGHYSDTFKMAHLGPSSSTRSMPMFFSFSFPP